MKVVYYLCFVWSCVGRVLLKTCNDYPVNLTINTTGEGFPHLFVWLYQNKLERTPIVGNSKVRVRVPIELILFAVD